MLACSQCRLLFRLLARLGTLLRVELRERRAQKGADVRHEGDRALYGAIHALPVVHDELAEGAHEDTLERVDIVVGLARELGVLDRNARTRHETLPDLGRRHT